MHKQEIDKMARPRISDDINRVIEQQWANEVKLAHVKNRKPRAVNVWRAMHGNVLRDPPKEKQKCSLSHVEKRIQKLEDNRKAVWPDKPSIPIYESWRPWLNRHESPEDRVFLLRLSAIKQAEFGLGLLQHEAEWGCKLIPIRSDRVVYASALRQALGDRSHI
jgi:hypothetical protein